MVVLANEWANWGTHKMIEAASITLGAIELAGAIDAFNAARSGVAGEVVIRPKLTMEKVIESSNIRKSKPNAKAHFYEHKTGGGYEQAVIDFERLEGLTDVKVIEGKFRGFQGRLPDGTTVSVRDGSAGTVSGKSEVTLQFNTLDGKSSKVRY